jgi:hypothetical protein
VDRHPINELFYAPQGPMKSSKQSFNFPTIESVASKGVEPLSPGSLPGVLPLNEEAK